MNVLTNVNQEIRRTLVLISIIQKLSMIRNRWCVTAAGVTKSED